MFANANEPLYQPCCDFWLSGSPVGGQDVVGTYKKKTEQMRSTKITAALQQCHYKRVIETRRQICPKMSETHFNALASCVKEP